MKNFAAARRFRYGTNANSFINPKAAEQIVDASPDRSGCFSTSLVRRSALIRAAASTHPFDGVYSSEENMAIESSPRIVSTTVLGLR